MPPPASTPKCPKCHRRIAAEGAKCIYCSKEYFKVLKRLALLLKPHRKKILLLSLINAISVAIALAPPYITKHIVDDVIMGDGNGRVGKLLFFSSVMVAIATAKSIARYYGGVLSSKVGTSIVYKLRSALHNALQHVELSFFGTKSSGEYTGRIMHDTEDVQRFLVDGSSDLLIQVLTMLGIAGILINLNFKLALVAFLPIIPLVMLSTIFHKKIHTSFHDQGTSVAKLNTHISETIHGIRTIKAFTHENARSKTFDDAAGNLARIRVTIETVFQKFVSQTDLLLDLVVTIVWFSASYLIIGGSNLTIGSVTAFIGYMTMFYGPIRWMTHIVNHMVNAIVSAERIFYILDAPQEDTLGGKLLPDKIDGEIEIRNARFAYEEGKDVLKGLSLQIKSGEMIGLVGHSGVGKSTLINLICRFYKLNSGEILIDGVNVNDLNPDQYRKKIGMVLQEPFLFNATIRENIACAKPNATEEEVIAASIAAHAHDFITKKDEGYDTIVGEGGALLSGGEKQRIAIARAILHNPPILILDEATSAVDTETEQLIRDALAKLCRGRTVIAIAHRLSTLKNANRLAVIEDGHVEELGTHEELLSLGGIYSRLVKAQTELNKIKTDAFDPL